MEEEKEIKNVFRKFKHYKGWKIRKVIKKNVFFLFNARIENAFGHFLTLQECEEFVKNKENELKNRIKSCKGCGILIQLQYGNYCNLTCYNRTYKRKRRNENKNNK